MNIGCDIVENNRLKNKGDRFIDLVLTEYEKQLYQEKGLPFLCGRYAAKEAIMKVLPNTKDIAFKDLEIVNNSQGSPYCVQHPEIALSISHEKKYTIAVALNNE